MQRTLWHFRLPSPGCLGVATALLVLLGLGVSFAWQMNGQIALVRQLEQSGVSVVTEPAEPDWLRRRLRSQWLKGVDRVVSIQSGRVELDDADLERLSGLTSVRHVEHLSPAVTDDGLKHLAALTQLRSVQIVSPHVTNDGLQHLRGLTRLESLDLYWAQVSDDGLTPLATLTSLRQLTLGATQVSDEGVTALQRKLPGCKIRKW